MDSPAFSPVNLRHGALAALAMVNPASKAMAAATLWSMREQLAAAAEETIAQAAAIPGRPARPELIHPAKVPRRSPFKPEGHAALMHAIAHIEFNAINLALDAVWRFPGMPREFYLDWLRVAKEEAYHFTLLRDHLASLGYAYGDFPAHDNLWTMCERTKDDIVARMALVPRTLEARGLDATPQIQARLRNAGTPQALEAAALLDIILRDEEGHVAIGNHWYRLLCEREGLDPVAHYGVLVRQYDAPKLYPPYNEEARRRAGFTKEEMDWLAG